jgi:hypothetical protein
MLFGISYHPGEDSTPDHVLIYPFDLSYSQLRSFILPGHETCLPPNMKYQKVALIAMFAMDVILVLTMLVGLFRFLNPGEGMYGLGHRLWQQVR